MCGIAGFLNYDFRDNYFRQVNQLQAHRGPDHQGHWTDSKIMLFHQRLSIIDLSDKANQPFIKDGLIIIFNGEIYNYKELKEDLISKGVSFHTNSDTEVILELYRSYQHDCLNFLRGMYAFAIYNTTKHSLFIARDPFGIKPLFYISSGERFCFSSELKTLVQSPGFNKDINSSALVASLNYLWIPGKNSIFKEVKKVSPGHFLQVDGNGSVTSKAFHAIRTQINSLSEEEAIDLLNEKLTDSLKKHMVADVPVSAFLSGGLDSSIISVFAGKSESLTTYCIKIPDRDMKVEQMPDDAYYAAKVAQKFGFDHNEVEISPDIASDLPHLVYHLDEPLGDPAAINTYLICKEARKNGSKVVLSGMGADELFFGYRRQKALLLASKYRKIPGPLRKMISASLTHLPVRLGNRGLKFIRWAKRFDTFSNLDNSEAYMRSYSYYDRNHFSSLFNRDVITEVTELIDQHNRIFNSHYENDLINQMCFTDIHMFMQGLNLTYTDRASMAASVEVRVPFIDKEIIDLAMSIPGNQKYKNKESKYLLKRVAENYLPKEIVYRPKASFGAPIRSWISNDLTEMVNDLLSPQSIKKRGIFNPHFVSNLIESDRNGLQDNAYQIYHLLCVELWFQRFTGNSVN